MLFKRLILAWKSMQITFPSSLIKVILVPCSVAAAIFIKIKREFNKATLSGLNEINPNVAVLKVDNVDELVCQLRVLFVDCLSQLAEGGEGNLVFWLERLSFNYSKYRFGFGKCLDERKGFHEAPIIQVKD